MTIPNRVYNITLYIEVLNETFYPGKTYTRNWIQLCIYNGEQIDCNLIPGYALQFEFTFGCDELDERNWAVDFGGLKELKQWLKKCLTLTYLVAEDDP